MIAVSFALPAESSDFIRRLQNRTRRRGPARISSGSLHGIDVVVLHTGVGAKASKERMAVFLSEHGPNLLISAGFAGGLTNDLQPGDLLLADNFSSATLLASAQAALAQKAPHLGKLATTETMADSLGEREALARETGACAVDMETAIIAAACSERDLPLLSLRVVTDTPEFPFPAPAHVLFDLEKQKTKLTALVSYLARNPAALGRLAAFGKRVAAARHRLSEALELLIKAGLG